MLPAQAAASGPALPASGPQERLLDTEATRQAIREAGRQPLLSERAAAGERPSAGDRLAQRMRESGKGDCLKGEYVSLGQGLLGIPFFLAAEVTGQCAK